MDERMNTQTGPYPDELDALVGSLRYRPGWLVALKDIERDRASTHGAAARGLTFIVTTNTVNSYRPAQKVTVNHYFPVPAATYNRASWLRWLFDCMVKVETHECMEFFALEDYDACAHCGQHDEPDGDHSCPCPSRDGSCGHATPWTIRPFAATHGPGDDPYVVHEYGTDEQRRTSFRGEVA